MRDDDTIEKSSSPLCSSMLTRGYTEHHEFVNFYDAQLNYAKKASFLESNSSTHIFPQTPTNLNINSDSQYEIENSRNAKFKLTPISSFCCIGSKQVQILCPPLFQFYKSGHKIWTRLDLIEQNELIGATLNLAQNTWPYTREIKVNKERICHSRRYASRARHDIVGIAASLSPSRERINHNVRMLAQRVMRQLSPMGRNTSSPNELFLTPETGSPNITSDYLHTTDFNKHVDTTFEEYCGKYRGTHINGENIAINPMAIRPISFSNASLLSNKRRIAFQDRGGSQSRSMGQASSSSQASFTQFQHSHPLAYQHHLTGSGSQLSSSFSANFDCAAKIFDDSIDEKSRYQYDNDNNTNNFPQMPLPSDKKIFSKQQDVPQQKSISVTFGVNGLLSTDAGAASGTANGEIQSFFKRHSAVLQKSSKIGKEKDGKKQHKCMLTSEENVQSAPSSSSTQATQKNRASPASVYHADSTISEKELLSSCACGHSAINAPSSTAVIGERNLPLCRCSVHNNISLHNLEALNARYISPAIVCDVSAPNSMRNIRKKSGENNVSGSSSRNSSRSGQGLLSVSPSASSSLTPSPTVPSTSNQFNYSMNSNASTKNRGMPSLSPQKNSQTRRSTSAISVSARQIITYCMENARGDLAGRVIGRMAHKREDFANFCSNMNAETLKAFTNQLREYLMEVSRNLQSTEKIRELSIEFGKSQVSRRSFGFKADFFSIMADALTTECVFLDAAAHQTTDAIEAWSELIGIMFSSIRDGYYQQVRYLRRNNVQALGTGQSSDQSVDNPPIQFIINVPTENPSEQIDNQQTDLGRRISHIKNSPPLSKNRNFKITTPTTLFNEHYT